MYYIKNGLGKNWHWLAIAFAVFGMIAGFGIGNSVQANSVAHGLSDSFGLPPWITGVTLAVLVGMVVLGGIGSVTGRSPLCDSECQPYTQRGRDRLVVRHL